VVWWSKKKFGLVTATAAITGTAGRTGTTAAIDVFDYPVFSGGHGIATGKNTFSFTMTPRTISPFLRPDERPHQLELVFAFPTYIFINRHVQSSYLKFNAYRHWQSIGEID
jgi:hypothetical protein